MSFCKEAPSAIGRPLAYGKTDRLWPHFKVMGAAMITPGEVAIGDKHGSKQAAACPGGGGGASC